MKKIILIFSAIATLCTMTISANAQFYNPPFVSYTPVFDTTQRNLRQVMLDDGVYELAVEYKSHTSHSAQYVLNVRIQNDTVTAIYFDDGGSVHSGYNNSGYTWSGGGIRWRTDYYGNITNGHAIIQVTYRSGGWQLFTIRF